MLSANVSDERLNRALIAFLRQEVQAPANAVSAFLDIIVEDARRLHFDHLLSDLDRIRSASERLNTFIIGLVQGRWFGGEELKAFQACLRHYLRTPLNAIKGYSELMIEDIAADGEHPLRSDLVKVRESADQLLGQIDSMLVLTRREEAEPNRDGEDHLGMLADVLGSVEPLRAGSAGRAAQPSRILVVDDNAANRDLLARRLARQGHEVVTAASGGEGLELAEGQPFDLVLLDLIMPDMSGFDLLRRLKTAEATSHVPVVVVSALNELDSVVRCIELGAEDYLTKPFDPILLRARIDASLERKRLRDREKTFITGLEQERRRSEALLLNILPQRIVDRLRQGETAIADRIDAATILFCDLVGFTALTCEMAAGRSLDILSEIFAAFDRLAAEHGVEKIKTIGDAYMAAAGVPDHQADHATRIARLASRMLAVVDRIADATDLTLQARIGMHTGPVIAGVIGTHKFVYDVWGDTVNTASRMERHSLPGRIHATAAMRMALGDQFEFEPRGIMNIKGKGMMETYFLRRS